MKGYKVFNSDWTCKSFQYKVGETYEEDVEPKCCEQGFHFCTELIDCFNYYRFNPNNKVAEIEALGKVDTGDEDTKCCTNKIKIVKELTWEEVLKLVNIGKNNRGMGNSGHDNIGIINTGSYNKGNNNSGSFNYGTGNTGHCNYGDWNVGNNNYGHQNTGYYNSGSFNVGSHNDGIYNSGNYNIGDCNIGILNNSDYNIGDCNNVSYSLGCFNTKESKILMFNKPSNWTYKDWKNSKAEALLGKLPMVGTVWIGENEMADEEKKLYSKYKIVGGCLRTVNRTEVGQVWWDKLTPIEKDEFRKLPNFDKEIFAEIMGIDINTI